MSHVMCPLYNTTSILHPFWNLDLCKSRHFHNNVTGYTLRHSLNSFKETKRFFENSVTPDAWSLILQSVSRVAFNVSGWLIRGSEQRSTRRLTFEGGSFGGGFGKTQRGHPNAFEARPCFRLSSWSPHANPPSK